MHVSYLFDFLGKYKVGSVSQWADRRLEQISQRGGIGARGEVTGRQKAVGPMEQPIVLRAAGKARSRGDGWLLSRACTKPSMQLLSPEHPLGTATLLGWTS